jgi:hypothetical protein
MHRFCHVVAAMLAGLLFAPQSSWACAVCYGEPDAPMSRGLTWAVVVLAGMVVTVLAGVTGFFVHVSRRARAQAQNDILAVNYGKNS